jgi:hypothetical protein
MWTLKEKSVRRVTQEEVKQNKLPEGRLLMLHFTLVFTDGEQDISVATFIKTKDEARNTINQNLNFLNEQEELEKEIADDVFELDVPKEEPTAEEIAKQENQKDEDELQEAIRKVKLQKEAEELAVENNDVKVKLDQFNAKK